MAEQKTGPTVEVLDRLIKRHMGAAFIAGLMPIPVVDVAVLSGVQLHLVTELAEAYGVPFSENRARILIGTLTVGAVPAYSAPLFAGLLKVVPAAGTTLGLVSMPILAAASKKPTHEEIAKLTYAIWEERGGDSMDNWKEAKRRLS
jgi:uncharacterized protein (DUF697 family)